MHFVLPFVHVFCPFSFLPFSHFILIISTLLFPIDRRRHHFGSCRARGADRAFRGQGGRHRHWHGLCDQLDHDPAAGRKGVRLFVCFGGICFRIFSIFSRICCCLILVYCNANSESLSIRLSGIFFLIRSHLFDNCVLLLR
jgi:hypothetical protein